MKKRKLRIVALMLLVALIMPCYANAGDGEAQKDKMLTDEEQLELMLKQAPAMTAYEQLMEAWIDEGGEDILPEAFGGFYHTDDFKLAIKVVGNDERFIAHTKEIVDDPSILKFVETDISFDELRSLNATIWDSAPSGLVAGSGIDQEQSLVRVYIRKTESTNGKSAAVLSQIANLEHVEVVFDEGSTQMQTAYRPGSMILPKASSTDIYEGLGTLGWYGTYQFSDGVRRDCFVTAGHVERAFKRANADMFFGQYRAFSRAKYPTSVTNTQYCVVNCGDGIIEGYPSGTSVGDYAIMAYNVPNSGVSTTDSTNQLQMPIGTMSVSKYLRSGTTIPKTTRIAKGRGVGGDVTSWGYIQEVDTFRDQTEKTLNGVYATVTISGLYSIVPSDGAGTFFSRPGDSGGPIYYIDNGAACLIGFISFGPNPEDPKTQTAINLSYITPITILTSKGFTPYVG